MTKQTVQPPVEPTVPATEPPSSPTASEPVGKEPSEPQTEPAAGPGGSVATEPTAASAQPAAGEVEDPAAGAAVAPGAQPALPPKGGVSNFHRLGYLVAAAAAFGLAPLSSRLGTTLGSVLLIALGVGLALAAAGTANAIAAATGALGAFASGLLAAMSPPIAGATLVTLCFVERTLRVRDTKLRVLHVALAMVGGALAGYVAAAYSTAELSIRLVALVVAAVLAALPLFLDADDPRAHALDDLATRVPEPTARLLRQGADLCRAADESLLDRQLLRQVRGSWRKLLQLAQARARLHQSHHHASGGAVRSGTHALAVARLVDQQIAQHVAALTRAYTAVDAAQAAEASLDDSALRSVQTSGESLEQVAEAIVVVEDN